MKSVILSTLMTLLICCTTSLSALPAPASRAITFQCYFQPDSGGGSINSAFSITVTDRGVIPRTISLIGPNGLAFAFGQLATTQPANAYDIVYERRGGLLGTSYILVDSDFFFYTDGTPGKWITFTTRPELEGSRYLCIH